jgi:hypothetical protein
MQAVVLPDLQGKGQVRQRSIFAVLIFGSFHQGKEQLFGIYFLTLIARNYLKQEITWMLLLLYLYPKVVI